MGCRRESVTAVGIKFLDAVRRLKLKFYNVWEAGSAAVLRHSEERENYYCGHVIKSLTGHDYGHRPYYAHVPSSESFKVMYSSPNYRPTSGTTYLPVTDFCGSC